MNNQDMTIPNFVSVSDLQRNYPGLLRQLKKSQKPLLILKNNSLEAVVISPEVYRQLMDKIAEWEINDAMESIKVFKEEEKAGKLKVAKKASDFYRNES